MPRTAPQPLALLFTEDDLGDLYPFTPAPYKTQPQPQHDDILAALRRAVESRRPPSPPSPPSPLTPPTPPTPPPPPLSLALAVKQSPTLSLAVKQPPMLSLALAVKQSPPPSPPTPIPLSATPRKKARSRRRSPLPPSPSRFCHVCARTQKSEKIFCANLHTDKKCRKAVCRPCFREMKWDFDDAKLSGTWLCPHCRGICHSVPRARCHIYTKTNLKRKASRLLGATTANEPC